MEKQTGGLNLADYRKAMLAVLTPLVSIGVTAVGLDLPDGVVAGITSALTGAAVYMVANSYGTG